MIDQLTIGDKASYTDFGASVATRKIKPPKKKSIKETVPFSNITYDFSAITGETYWEERELEYTLEITADDPEQLEELKRKLSAWVMGVRGQKLQDPHIPDYHFLATYDDMDIEDDEGLDKCTLTVTFTAYPYKVANVPKVYKQALTVSSCSITILNESDHPVTPTIECEKAVTIVVGLVEYSLSAGTTTNRAIKLPTGLSTIEVSTSAAGVLIGDFSLSFYEEVF